MDIGKDGGGLVNEEWVYLVYFLYFSSLLLNRSC